MSRPLAARVGGALKSAAPVLVGFALFLALGEAAIRLLNRDGRFYDVEMFKYSRALKRDAPPEAPEMHHWHRAGAAARLQGVEVKTNSKGLRDHEYEYQPRPGVTRILALGDSITLGWGVSMQQSYPKVLERLLNGGSSRDRFEVLNAGVGNYTTRRIIALYRHELHRYQAKVVLLSFFINNANDTPDSPLRFLFDTPLQFPVFLWSRAQRVGARYGVNKGFDAYYAELYSDGSPLWEKLKSELGPFLRQLREQGKRVVVVSVPDVFHLEEPRYRYQFVTDKLFEVARRAGVESLDLFPALQGLAPGSIMNTPEDRHPNAEGHRRMGQALFDHLTSPLDPVLARKGN